MTPAARLQATIEILEALERTNAPADRFLREWFRDRRYAGSKDRAAVSERLFAILRHRGFLSWRMACTSPRALVIASVLAEAGAVDALETLFGGDGYGPPALSDAERAAIATVPKTMPPLSVQGEFPTWLEAELKRSLGEALIEEMRALCERASVDLRVNSLKASRDDVMRLLADEGFVARATPMSPLGIRLAAGEKLSALSRLPAFEEGLFEFQDEAAQIASLLVDANPGERILDLAAGAGGKALALAAAMSNTGEIVACDIDAKRLAQLAPRAARAGVTIIEAVAVDAAKGPFDTVLVDAPCSGTGTWRRQPELKWRLTPEKLAELEALQDTLLARAVAYAPKRIIYATCSLLKCENEDRVGAFLERHARYRLQPVSDVWRVTLGTEPPSGTSRCFHASPLKTGTDGFFAAVLVQAAAD